MSNKNKISTVDAVKPGDVIRHRDHPRHQVVEVKGPWVHTINLRSKKPERIRVCTMLSNYEVLGSEDGNFLQKEAKEAKN